MTGLNESVAKLITREFMAGIPPRQTAERVIKLIRTAEQTTRA
jgi:hypothetical protein